MSKFKKKPKVVKGKMFEVKHPFKTTKREYKIGDSIELFSEKEINYLKSINKI